MNAKRKKAKELFLETSYPFKKIAEESGVSPLTICKWATDDDWVSAKEEYVLRKEETQYNKMVQNLNKISERYLLCTLFASEMGAKSLSSILNGNGSEYDIEDVKEVEKWMKILRDGSSVIKNVVPDAMEDQVNAMMEELQRISGGVNIIEGESS